MMTGLFWMKTSREGDTNAGVGAHSARQLVGYNWHQAASRHSPMLLLTTYSSLLSVHPGPFLTLNCFIHMPHVTSKVCLPNGIKEFVVND